MSKKPDFTPTACKYCGAADLVWILEPNGKWLMTENYGLPHGCKEKSEFFRKQMQEKNEALKKTYQEEKARLAAIPDNSPCSVCQGQGRIYSLAYANKCSGCYGSGKLTAKDKAYKLYKLRTALWPGINKHKG